VTTPTYEYTINPGDNITVVFADTTPDLLCVYQRLWAEGNTLIATYPQGGEPTATIYLDDFQYFYKGTLV
jgi:hypothetical protein